MNPPQRLGAAPFVALAVNANNLLGPVSSTALTAVPAGSLTGSIADARLSANVALRAGGNAFTGNQVVTSGNLGIGTAAPGYPLTVQGSGNAVYSVMSEDGTQAADNLTVQIAPGGGASTSRIGYLFGNFGNSSAGFMIANLRNAPLRFGTGAGPTEAMRIATVDESGVALAAIQGLNQKLEATRAESRAKDREIEALEQSVAELRALIQATGRRQIVR